VYRETGGGTGEDGDEDNEKNNTFSILTLDGALGWCNGGYEEDSAWKLLI